MPSKYLISIIFILISSFAFTQSKIDSLYKEIEKTKNDSAQIDLYLKISKEYFENDDYINYTNTLATIKKKFNYENSINRLNNYYKLLSFFKEINLYDSVVIIYNKIANEYLKNKDSLNYIINKNNEAYQYSILGMQKKSLEILYDNLRFADKKNDSSLLSETYLYLGFGTRKSNYKKAKQYFENSINYNNDTLSSFYSTCLNEIGNIFTIEGKPEKAIPYLRRALKIRKLTNDESISYSYNDIAYAYAELGNFYDAILYMHKCIDYEIKKGVKWELALSYSAIGYYYMKAGKMSNAEKYLNISLEYAKKLKVNPVFNDVYKNLYQFYKIKKDYKTALYYYELSENYEDTILANNTERQIAELEKKYINEKQASKLFIMKKEKEAVDTTILRQRIFGIIIVFSIIILLFFLNSVIKSKRKSKEANNILSIQNEEIKQKNIQIEKKTNNLSLANKKIAKKNFFIRDNIKYARKIQKAMLTSKDEINRIIPENFIIYKPKEIVSGDFYSIKEINDKIIIVVGDSTGHGVSGGFMSILGMSLINEIIKESTLKPAEVLNTLRKRIINSLHQKKKHTVANDGMDIAFCVYDKKLKQLQFSGAQISLYIATNNGINEIKADMMTAGVGLSENKDFTQKTIDLVGNETFYLFSDGYPDQFGGKNGKKFMIGRVKKMLSEIHDKPMNIQKNYIEANLKTWQAGFKQIDDILFIGFKLS